MDKDPNPATETVFTLRGFRLNKKQMVVMAMSTTSTGPNFKILRDPNKKIIPSLRSGPRPGAIVVDCERWSQWGYVEFHGSLLCFVRCHFFVKFSDSRRIFVDCSDFRRNFVQISSTFRRIFGFSSIVQRISGLPFNFRRNFVEFSSNQFKSKRRKKLPLNST